MEDKPVVREVETGVVYGHTSLFTGYENQQCSGPMELWDDPRRDLEELITRTGRVLSCRVLTCQPAFTVGGESTHVQTSLVIEAEQDTGAYW